MCMKFPAGRLQMCLFSSTNATLMSPFPKLIGLQTPPARLDGTIWASCCAFFVFNVLLSFMMDYSSAMGSGWEEFARLCICPFKQENCEKQHRHFRPERHRKTKHRNAISCSATLAISREHRHNEQHPAFISRSKYRFIMRLSDQFLQFWMLTLCEWRAVYSHVLEDLQKTNDAVCLSRWRH